MQMALEQRITLRQLSPNPLFEQWLQDWLSYAERKNSLKKYALAKALDSLRRYPLVMHSGRDCCILDGFGQTICRMIDKQLEVYRKNNIDGGCGSRAAAGESWKRPVSEAECDRSMQEVIAKVQTEMVKKQRQTRKKKKDVVGGASNPLKDLFNKYNEPFDAKEVDTIPEECAQTEVEANEVVVPANSYEIILLVDTQETAGKSKRSLDTTIKELERHRVRFEVRRLSVGDFLWICRSTQTTTSAKEYVLPHIVERKRMDDLAGSIKDGRFHEQKFRLCDSGIANVVYLIESRGQNQHVGLPVQNLLQAATNTQVQNGFVVKFSGSHVESMLYLVVMTELLHEIYKNKSLIVSTTTKPTTTPLAPPSPIPVLDFTQFSASTTKMRNFRIRDLFVRQLLQLKTLTLDKALAIVQHFPTPTHLLRKYASCVHQKEAEMVVANITCGPTRKAIGPAISKCLYHFYHAQQAS